MGCTGNMGINYHLIMADKTIPLTAAEYRNLERAMQWPEDIAAYEKLNTPTPLFGSIQNDQTIKN